MTPWGTIVGAEIAVRWVAVVGALEEHGTTLKPVRVRGLRVTGIARNGAAVVMSTGTNWVRVTGAIESGFQVLDKHTGLLFRVPGEMEERVVLGLLPTAFEIAPLAKGEAPEGMLTIAREIERLTGDPSHRRAAERYAAGRMPLRALERVKFVANLPPGGIRQSLKGRDLVVTGAPEGLTLWVKGTHDVSDDEAMQWAEFYADLLMS